MPAPTDYFRLELAEMFPTVALKDKIFLICRLNPLLSLTRYPITYLDKTLGLREIVVNRSMKVLSLSALCTGRLYLLLISVTD
jgi:hypothetical protein